MKKTLLAMLVAGAAVSANAYELKILHINDHHSRIDADGGMNLDLGGESTRVRSGGMPMLATLFKEKSQEGNVLKLHAGDALTGDIYYTLTRGGSDAAVMNEICFDAFTVGNHEFDGGDANLKTFIDYLDADAACKTDVLGANVAPAVGTPLAPKDAEPLLKPYVIKEVGGEKVGIIGIVIAGKTKNSSSPDETTEFLDEVETAQKYIDELKAQDVKKIVLLTHNQYKRELDMMSALTDVDVLVGGDSHTLLGQDFAEYGLSVGGEYPSMVTNKDGDKACVVQAWQYSQIFGELNVTFDGDKVASCSGAPVMPLADSFKRKNDAGDRVELEGDAREAAIKVVEASDVLQLVEEDASMRAIVDEFNVEADKLKAEKIAVAIDDMCLERIPGQAYRNCDAEALQPSEVAVVVAEAFLYQSKLSDFAIQNAGGVRENIVAGDFSVGDAYKLLPFSNTLVEFEMTGTEVHAVLEDALDFALADSTGAYPYGAGIRFDVVASEAKGNRIQNIDVRDRHSREWSPIDMERTYTLVTNNYIGGGKDGYVTFGEIAKDDARYVDTYLDYAQAFVDYVNAKGKFGKVPAEEMSTKSFVK